LTKISKALSPEQVSTYYKRDYSLGNGEKNYFSQGVIGGEAGEYFGKEAAAFGLIGQPVTEEVIWRLAVGQDPNTGEQLIKWRPAGQAKPDWVRDDAAWSERVGALFESAILHRDPFSDHGQIPKAPKGAEEFAGPTPRVRTEREATLLEMHSIARSMYAENLASAAGAGARMYLKERGIRLDTAQEFGLGLSLDRPDQLAERLREYGPDLMRASGLFVERGGKFTDRFRDRLMFPIEAETGETVAFAGRKPPNEERGPKYLNSPATEIYQKGATLYNVNRAQERAHQTGQMVVVEGYLDVMAAWQAGQRNVVAQSGTALSAEQAALIRRHAGEVISGLDGDEAGREATGRNIPMLLDAGLHVRVMDLPDAKDAAEFLTQNKAKVYRDQVRQATALVEYLTGRAAEKFDVREPYGKVDAVRWMAEQLEHVRPEQRAQIGSELEAWLKHPPEEIQQSKASVEHRAAWDLTISAPKTVSLTALVGGDERVLVAHTESAKEAFAYAERSLQVKMGGLNPPETTGRMMGVLFVHDTARPVDGYAAPQLHTHGLIFNMSRDSAGQMRALNPQELFYLQGTVEAVYQNSIALRLKALGYELEYGKNLAVEIKGYTEEYRKAESARDAQIRAEQEKRQQFGQNAHEFIAQNTRSAKQDLPPEEVRARHRARAAEFGNQPDYVIAAARDRQSLTYSPQYRSELADEALTFAKAKLSERTAVMEDHEIHREALRFGRGYITLEDVEGAFQRRVNEFVEVHHWREHSPGQRWTTPELLEKERAILQFMAAGRDQLAPMAGGITKDEFRERFKERLSDHQKHLVWNIIHSSDRMVGVQGLAGTGKTLTVGALREFVVDYGFEVRGLAATSGAVSEMNAAGMESRTMQSFLASNRLANAKPKRPAAYFVDEASLADVHVFSEFLTYTRPADRVFVIGDARQHGPLGAGKPFEELQNAGMTTFHLRKIVRQVPEEYREVVKHLAAGNVPQALAMLDEQRRIHVHPAQDERHGAIAREVVNSPARTLVVSPDNASRLAISESIRAAKQEAGQLGQNVYRSRSLIQRSDMAAVDICFAASYEVGNVVLYARPMPSHAIQAGDYASVVSVDRDKNLLTVMREKDGGVVTYNPATTGRGATVYDPSYREFAVGERVQFTKQWKEGRTVKAANRQIGTVDALDDGGNVTVRLDVAEGKPEKVLRWNLEEMAHLDHGYVMTSYTSQGATADKVIIQIDTDAPGAHKLLNEQLAYVAASRGRHDVQIFANDREELDRYLSRAAEKATALAPEQQAEYRPMIRK
jgi:DNA primase catalytic core